VSAKIVLTMAAVPAAWVNGTTVAVQITGGMSGTNNYGALGVWPIEGVTGTTITLTGAPTFPTGATTFPSGFTVTDHEFTVNAAAAAAIAAAPNDAGGIGPPGVRIQVATPTEYMVVCALAGLKITLCPADNSAGMRNTVVHFGSHYVMHWFARCQDFECGSVLGESKLWLGTYFGGFWVNGLTDGTNTPRLDFNPYLYSLGRFPFVAPDGHTLTSTWARAKAGFEYDAQSFNRWIFSNSPFSAGLGYASQMNGTVAWAADFGTPNASLAWTWLTSTGNLHSLTSVNNAIDAKWLFAPHVIFSGTVTGKVTISGKVTIQ